MEELERYAKEKGFALSKQNVYPHFLKYEANRYPWSMKEEADQEIMATALKLVNAIADHLAKFPKNKKKQVKGQYSFDFMGETEEEFDFPEIKEQSTEVPCYDWRGDQVAFCGMTKLPGKKIIPYDRPTMEDQILLPN